MKYLLLCLALLGCEAPKFSFETEGLPCSAPAEVTEATKQPNTKGCWRLTAEPGHGFTLDDPGLVSCNDGTACIVVVPGQTFWNLGAGHNQPRAEDVDCSETCDANP
jgi:hypothetical protein